MSKYQFSTVKLIPNLVRDESVNIGVILYDSTKNKAYPKFTKNWKEVSRRTGVDRLPDLPKIIKIETIKTDDDYLNALYSKNFQDSLVITKPKLISLIETPSETLEMLFDTQVSLPSEDTLESRTVKRFRGWLGDVITSRNFPDRSYKTQYKFDGTIVDKRFPYVFMKDKFPYLGIDYLSFVPNTILNNTKLRSFDINLIRAAQTTKKTNFKLFSAQDKDEIDLKDTHVQKSLKILELSDIPIIYKNDSEYELDKIRKILVTT